LPRQGQRPIAFIGRMLLAASAQHDHDRSSLTLYEIHDHGFAALITHDRGASGQEHSPTAWPCASDTTLRQNTEPELFAADFSDAARPDTALAPWRHSLTAPSAGALCGMIRRHEPARLAIDRSLGPSPRHCAWQKLLAWLPDHAD